MTRAEWETYLTWFALGFAGLKWLHERLMGNLAKAEAEAYANGWRP